MARFEHEAPVLVEPSPHRDLLRLRSLRRLKAGEHRTAESLLAAPLRIHGVNPPMASTFLRFRLVVNSEILTRRGDISSMVLNSSGTAVAGEHQVYTS